MMTGSEIKATTSALAEARFTKNIYGKLPVCDVNPQLTESQDNKTITLNNVIDTEFECYNLIRFQGSILHPQTHCALIYLYGRTISYLLAYGSENNTSWLASSVEIIQQRIVSIAGDIKIANAQESFTKALNIMILTESGNNQVNGLDKHLAKLQVDKKVAEISTTVSRVVESGSFLMTTGMAIGFAGTVLAWPVVLPMLAGAAYLAVNEKYRNSRLADYDAYYSTILLKIYQDFKIIKVSVEDEIEYHEFRLIQCKQLSQINDNLLNILNECYQLFKSDENLKSDEDTVFLQQLRDFIDGSSKSTQKSILSESEKEKLKAHGFELENLDEDMLLQLRQALQSIDDVAPGESHGKYDPRFLASPSNRSIVIDSDQSLLPPSSSSKRGSNLLLLKLPEIQQLLQSATMFLQENQDRDIVEIIIHDEKIAQRFQQCLLGQYGIHHLGDPKKEEPRKITVIESQSTKALSFKILLTADEYNSVLNDRDAYAKLVSYQSSTNMRP